MKIYFSVDLETEGGESEVNLTKLMEFLQNERYIVYRAPYALSNNPDTFLKNLTKSKKNLSLTKQREIHIKWIDEADLLLAEISAKSEGRAMIIQRALDKPFMGRNNTPIIIIKGNRFKRKIGKIVKGLIASEEVIYFEYDEIDEVIKQWPKLIKQAFSK